MEFKFTASNVDAIESATKELIANVVTDTRISNMSKVIEKAGINEQGTVGMSNSLALKKIDEYLENEDNDIDDLSLDMTEALVKAGFLSRELEIDKMRQLKTSRSKQAMEQIDKALLQ